MKMFLVFAVLMFSLNLAAQDGTSAKFLIWDADGTDARIDINGAVVKKESESNIGEFSEGLATITVGDKYGFVNEKGEVVIAPQWTDRTRLSRGSGASFHEGLAAVIEEVIIVHLDDNEYSRVKCGYINKLGEYVIKPQYRRGCDPFSNGLARTQLDIDDKMHEINTGDIGFIDHEGKWAIRPQYITASNFINGYALVQSDPWPADLYVKYGSGSLVRHNYERKSLYLIDPSGKPANGIKDCRWRYSYYEGLALSYNESNRPVFLDEQCRQELVLPDGVQPEDHPKFTEGRLLVHREYGKERLYGYLDRAGKLVIPFRFTAADQFSDGLAGVRYRENGETINGYIDRGGIIHLKNTRGITPFHDGLSLQHLFTWTIGSRPDSRNIYGYMNKQGKYVWLSPRAAIYLNKEWLKENYIGPDTAMRR